MSQTQVRLECDQVHTTSLEAGSHVYARATVSSLHMN